MQHQLFIAAENGHLDVVRHLVEVGADKDQAGIAVQHHCTLQLRTAILMLSVIWWKLVLTKIRPGMTGATPLYIAAQ